jgi:hypothetical protein
MLVLPPSVLRMLLPCNVRCRYRCLLPLFVAAGQCLALLSQMVDSAKCDKVSSFPTSRQTDKPLRLWYAAAATSSRHYPVHPPSLIK